MNDTEFEELKLIIKDTANLLLRLQKMYLKETGNFYHGEEKPLCKAANQQH